MTTLYSLTHAQTLTNLRTDLSDTDASLYRWQDADLNRAIDKALERYSWANPWLQAIQVQAVAKQICYASPAGAYFVDKVEYPQGQWPKQFQPFLERKSPLLLAPTTAPQVSIAGAGSLSAGDYSWAATYTVPGGGETTASPLTAATSGANGAATITLPLGAYGVSGRNLYRTTAGGSQLKLVSAIADNTSTIVTDTLADASLGVNIPTVNTTGNLDQLELQLPPELWPPDNTRILEITYAAKHQLDSAGTTIPERHWHVLGVGAVAYAMWAYLPQVNDNFDYVDGHLRDKVDDTKSTIAWQTQCQHAIADFEKLLKLVAEEANSATTRILHWGDVPLRWNTL